MQLFSKEKHIIHILLSEQVPFDIGQKPKVKKKKTNKKECEIKMYLNMID